MYIKNTLKCILRGPGTSIIKCIIRSPLQNKEFNVAPKLKQNNTNSSEPVRHHLKLFEQKLKCYSVVVRRSL